MPDYTWDLDHLLNGGTLDQLYEQWAKKNQEMIDLYPHFLKSENNFRQWLNENEELEKITNRLTNYITNQLNEDIANPEWVAWSQKLRNKSQEFSQHFSDYANIVIKNEDVIREYLKADDLKEYGREFDLIFRGKPHLLPEHEELLQTKLSAYNGGFEEIYSTLLDNDLTYADARSSDRKRVPLKTQADIFKNLKSMDRNLRKTTWLSFHESLFNVRNTLTQALYYNYLMLNTNAKVRKFPDYISSTAFADEIPVDFIQHVYKQVEKYKKLNAEYAKLRDSYLKKTFGIRTVYPWDGYIDLVKKEIKVSIEDCKRDAIDALRILGDDYVKQIQRAFDERWISWMPKVGKQTGAYSIGGTKGLDKYYISMNFNETLYSTYTVIHELGHSMNSYYFGQAQSIYQDCSIFYAEISSINNEMLLNHFLLNRYKDDPEMKLMILDGMIKGFFAATTRQVIFSNFEWIANQWVNEAKPFTYDNLAQMYWELNKKYTGQKRAWKNYEKSPWIYSLVTPLRISHFFVGNFYVYKYAVGQVASIIISDRITKNQPGAKEKFFSFLKSGDSLSPLDTIKLLGIDLTQKEPWIEAGKIVESWIEEFRKTMAEM